MLDRVRELRRVPANSLQPHPLNWRLHPPQQAEALRDLLTELGMASPLLARELADGTLQLLDGHLRAETVGDATVPVVIVDLDEQEGAKLLLTHDPLAAMATSDPEPLAQLLAGVATSSAAVESLLGKLQQQIAPPPLEAPEPPEVEIPRSYQVVVECTDELDQQQVYEQMRAAGYRCRVLTM